MSEWSTGEQLAWAAAGTLAVLVVTTLFVLLSDAISWRNDMTVQITTMQLDIDEMQRWVNESRREGAHR